MNYNDIFDYDGLLLIRKSNGEVAGSIRKDGYVEVSINDKSHLSHRIIWEMHNGKIPEGMQIDHINHIKWDNRIENLRMVDAHANGKNQSLCRLNKSGFNGVSWSKKAGKWRARVKHKGKEYHLGLFVDKLEAHKAVQNKLVEFGFHENHGKKTQ